MGYLEINTTMYAFRRRASHGGLERELQPSVDIFSVSAAYCSTAATASATAESSRVMVQGKQSRPAQRAYSALPTATATVESSRVVVQGSGPG